MMLKVVALFAAVALVSADVELDALEKAGRDIMSRLHPETGGEKGSSNSLFTALSNNDFIRGAAQELNRTRRERLEEGVGSGGVTFVSVTKGKKQVNVTNQYGVGAGIVLNVRDRKRTQLGEEIEEPSQQELDDIILPIFQKVVNPLANSEVEADGVRVVLAHGAGADLRIRDKRDDLRARARDGFKVAAHVTVSKRG